jgi:cystathionine beta-lyase/cystathionine gamma-synthase
MPIYPTSVWRCDDTNQAEQLLMGELQGYVYQRNGHPNADVLAQKLGELYGAEAAAVTSSGMAALSLAMLSQLQSGERVVLSRQLYGSSLQLLQQELPRLGIQSTAVDTGDLSATGAALAAGARMLVVETIANPMLRVADLRALADLAHQHQALLLVDNTFASPVLCRPLEWGADLVLDSISKIVNGQSDVMLGLLCGRAELWDRVPSVLSCWGLASSPFDCWLAARGLTTLALRIERACGNALAVARFLSQQAQVQAVHYPGLPAHAEHSLAARQLTGGFGWMVTFQLQGGRQQVDRFIERVAPTIPFCPSLGEISTTLSHPQSTSHRRMTDQQRAALGIGPGTIRLSVGIESVDGVISALRDGLVPLA